MQQEVYSSVIMPLVKLLSVTGFLSKYLYPPISINKLLINNAVLLYLAVGLPSDNCSNSKRFHVTRIVHDAELVT